MGAPTSAYFGRLLALALCVSACIAGQGTARATMLAGLGLEQTVRAASEVVTGKVMTRDSLWLRGGRSLHTVYEVEVLDPWKGALQQGSRIRLRFPGGEAAGLVAYTAGVPRFRPGEEVVLFLDRLQDGSFATVAWEQGAYRIDAGSASGARWARKLPASPDVLLVGRPEGKELPALIRLDDLKARVLEAMAAGGAP